MSQASQECKWPHSIKDGFARGQRRQGCRLYPAMVGGGACLHTRRLLESHFISQTTPPWQPDTKALVSSKLPCRVWGTEKACVCWLATCQLETRCAPFWDKAVGVES